MYHHSTASSAPGAGATVDADEVARFSALASSWWDPHGPSRLLHLMNPLRHAFLAECLASSSSASGAPGPLRILDVGCGAGIFAESAARLRHPRGPPRVTGLDPSAAVLAAARAHARRDPALVAAGNLEYVRGGVEDVLAAAAQKDAAGAHGDGAAADAGVDTAAAAEAGDGVGEAPRGRFDVVTCFEVLEHVARPSRFLAQASALVRDGGWLVGSTISRTAASWLVTKLAAEEVLRLVPRGTHDWHKYVRPDELREWFARRGEGRGGWDERSWRVVGVVYVPGLGWREVKGSEKVGNYFFGVRKLVNT
jgi:polyprenyldihydroxybenzoate methyltransferase/3-demethylubiquinol 3-O-methyltransferase